MNDHPPLPFESAETPERWLPVPANGWEKLYEVSNHGRVRSLPRWTASKGMRGGHVLKPWLNTHDYATVRLYRVGFREAWQVHRLVALAFIGPCPEGQQVRHGPNGKLDNRASELCYGTDTDNKEDMVRDGTRNWGERHGIAKLTWAIVAECRRRHAAGETQISLARQFGVDKATMNYVIKRKSWNHQPWIDLEAGHG